MNNGGTTHASGRQKELDKCVSSCATDTQPSEASEVVLCLQMYHGEAIKANVWAQAQVAWVALNEFPDNEKSARDVDGRRGEERGGEAGRGVKRICAAGGE